ncbi:MAG: trypsin-like peptidase domain-containing protein [Planctomycetota bacterium]
MARVQAKVSRILILLSVFVVGAVVGRAVNDRRSSGYGEPVTYPVVGQPNAPLSDPEVRASTVFERVSPSVVHITVLRPELEEFPGLDDLPTQGSGFIWDAHGHIVTNNHVVSRAEQIVVTLADGTHFEAELRGSYWQKDLAIIKIDAPPGRLQPISVGGSQDLRVGQTVYAIGNPFGYDLSLSVGVVSAVGRSIPTKAIDLRNQRFLEREIRDVIQTDAAINPGNSGGPLLDSRGQLIGVTTAIHTLSGGNLGLGFAIPVDTIRWAVPQLIREGQLIRPTLGVYIETSAPQVKRLQDMGVKGLLIRSVVDESAAAQARIFEEPELGLRRGDILTHADDTELLVTEDLLQLLDRRAAGDIVKLEFLRDGRKLEAEAVLYVPR